MKNLSNIWEKYYIHSTVLTLVLFLFYLLWMNNSFLYTSVLDFKNVSSEPFNWTIYPIEYVPNPFLLSYTERKKTFSEIDSKYFIKTPKYDSSVFWKDPDTLDTSSQDYIDTLTQRVIYTVPYMWTYNMDYKEYTWSHLWVDIIAPTWTPVRSIANWVVVKVWYEAGWFWNYVLIRHDNIILDSWKKSTIYSLYAHMNKSLTTAWSKVVKWDTVWEVWATWTATTSHLHFQIDLDDAPFSPYWPFTSADMKAAWVWFFDWINVWLWKENAIKYTINPLKFVNNNLNSVYTLNDEKEVTYTNQDNTTQEQNLEEQKNTTTETNTWAISENNTQTWSENEEQNQQSEVELNSAWDELILKDSEDLTILSDATKQVTESQNEETTSVPVASNDSSLNDPEQELIKLLNNLDDSEDDVTITNTWALNTLFSDIPDDYEHYKEIKYFKDNSIISGFSDDTFRPKNNITRAESLKVILLSLWISPVSWEESKFIDVKTDSWENSYINAWVNKWVISTTNPTFAPLRNISRAEWLKMILTLAWVDFSKLEKDIQVSDVSETDWYYNYVNYALKNNLIKLDNGKFLPNQALTREELVVILYNFVKK